MPLRRDIDLRWRATRRSLATALAVANLLVIGFGSRVLADTPSRPPFTGEEVYVKPEDDYIRAFIAMGIVGLGSLAVLRPGSRRYIAALIGIGIVALGILVAFTAFLDFSGQHKVNVGMLAVGAVVTLVGVAVVIVAIRGAKPRAQETGPGSTVAK